MKDIKILLSKDLVDHINNDAHMLSYFIQHDYVSFLNENVADRLPPGILEDHISYMTESAEKGDRDRVRSSISHLVFDYFPEFDEMFPAWWHRV